ncbi:hypothetical protein LG322_08720 [Microbacterium aerolatum]|uniref:hypothetical protein n=1 Tax=Microbacterium aerolatum TaxID=153731 RepID=UPI00384F61CC
MSKQDKADRAAAVAEIEADRAVERALRAVVMRREGSSWGDIAERLGVSQIEAQELARVAYARLGEAEKEHYRIESEDRIDSIIRKAHLDLALCKSQGERTALYRTLLAAEAQRARLLGLNLRAESEDHAD